VVALDLLFQWLGFLVSEYEYVFFGGDSAAKRRNSRKYLKYIPQFRGFHDQEHLAEGDHTVDDASPMGKGVRQKAAKQLFTQRAAVIQLQQERSGENRRRGVMRGMRLLRDGTWQGPATVEGATDELRSLAAAALPFQFFVEEIRNPELLDESKG